MLKHGQVSINVYVRCFAIIVVQENIGILFVTLTYLCTDLYFLCECFLYLSVINITPIIRVLVIETQSLVTLILSGKNKLSKVLTCSMPCGRERDLSEVI